MSNRQPTEEEVELAIMALTIANNNRTEANAILTRECGWRSNLVVRAFVVLDDRRFFDSRVT